MFGFNRKSRTQCFEEAKAYADKLLPEVARIVLLRNGDIRSAEAEFYGYIFLAFLSRETVDWKNIEPYLGDILLNKLKLYRFKEEERQKLRGFVHISWSVMANNEKDALKKGKNPLDPNFQLLIVDKICDNDPIKDSFLSGVKERINTLIRVWNLKSYAQYAFAVNARGAAPSSDRYREENLFTLEENGRQVRYYAMSTLNHGALKFLCLQNPENQLYQVIQVLESSNGRMRYCRSSEVTKRIVISLLKLNGSKLSFEKEDEDFARKKILWNIPSAGGTICRELVDIIIDDGDLIYGAFEIEKNMLGFRQFILGPEGELRCRTVTQDVANHLYRMLGI